MQRSRFPHSRPPPLLGQFGSSVNGHGVAVSTIPGSAGSPQPSLSEIREIASGFAVRIAPLTGLGDGALHPVREGGEGVKSPLAGNHPAPRFVMSRSRAETQFPIYPGNTDPA